MAREIEEKLTCSLTGAKTTELIPFLPYLLQDFWELGSDPDIMVNLINKYVNLSECSQILDLGCGKGAVSVKIAQKLRVNVKGIDLIPEFIEYAVQKAREFGVNDLCDFSVGDINETVKKERDCDCVIFGAVGNVLGNPAETLNKLKVTAKLGGYILFYEAFLSDDGKQEDIKYDYEYYTEKHWMALFKEMGLELIETVYINSSDSSLDMADITVRANELIEKYPDKKTIFEEYVHNQQNEYDDIENHLICATWLLRKGKSQMLK